MKAMQPFSLKNIWNNPDLFAAIIVIFAVAIATGPVQDGDLFWHLRTGQWIWQHHELPVSDPFSYTTTGDFEMIRSLLQRYWLGQLVLYGVWSLGGAAGIVLLRSLIYGGIVLFLWYWMRKRAQGIFALTLLMLTALVLRDFPNERPQIFTFVFVPIVLFIIEERRLLYALPLIMLAWANMHGGFILGAGLIAIYLTAELIKRRERKYMIVLAASLGFSCINAAGWFALSEFFTTQTGYRQTLYEHLSPLAAMLRAHDYYPEYWLALLIILGLLIKNRKQVAIAPTLAIICVAALSLTGLRYVGYLAMTAPLCLRKDVWSPACASAVGVLLVTVVAIMPWRDKFAFREEFLFPAQAVEFIHRAELPQPLFNFYDWGGYVMLKLPGYKVFTDSRTIDTANQDIYDQVLWSDQADTILERYGVQTIIIPGMSQFTGEIYPLTLRLAFNPQWGLAYADDVALVFTRASGRPVPEGVYSHIIGLSNRLYGRVNPKELDKSRFAAKMLLMGALQK